MPPKKVHMKWPDVSLLIMVSVALLYTAGWSYAYHYFTKYHLGFLDISISKEYFFVYAFWVIRNQWLLILVGFGLFFSTFIVIEIFIKTVVYPKLQQLHEKLPANSIQFCLFLCILLLHLCAFIFFYQTGKRAADSDYHYQAISDYPSYPLVKFWIKTHSKLNNQAFVDELKSGCYRLLLKNSGKLYIFFIQAAILKRKRLLLCQRIKLSYCRFCLFM